MRLHSAVNMHHPLIDINDDDQPNDQPHDHCAGSEDEASHGSGCKEHPVPSTPTTLPSLLDTISAHKLRPGPATDLHAHAL